MLPDSEDTRKIGVHTNQYKTVASIKIALFYDLLNNFYYHASLHPKQQSDLPCISRYVEHLPKKSLTVYDRGFGSILLLFLHTQFKSKCLIRLKVDFSTYVKEFVKSTDNERIIEVPLGEKCVKSLSELGINRCKTSTTKARLIRVRLPSGEDEILLTNLSSKELNLEEAYYLYGLRWGVETAINYSKNVFKLGIFSGYSKVAIFQDIWSNLICQNLHNVLLEDPELDSSLRSINAVRTHRYKVNRAVGLGTFLCQIKDIFTCSIAVLEAKIRQLLSFFVRSLEPIKSESKERIRRRQRPNDRHTTEYNYKHNF